MIEKKLLEIEGIKPVEASVNKGAVRIVYEDKRPLMTKLNKISKTESVKITLMKGDLSGILFAIKLSKITLRNVKQNLFRTFFYNIILIPVAAGILYPFFNVLLNPMLAAGPMAFSSISVVLNLLRLKVIKI